MKKIIAINAGPRTNWNTAQLVKEVGKGAESKGAEVEYIDLYKLDKFTGCISCFGCKMEASFGKCACHDGLFEVLEKIRTADGLIIGSPNYIGNLTAGFRALYERLIFQYLTYNKEKSNCNEHFIPTVLIMTSNCPEEMYGERGYTELLEGYRRTLSAIVGPTKVLTCGDTLQVDDYSKYDWTNFDPEAKKKRHDETFGDYLKKAFALGEEL
ncbi:MAG: flavodoxin family protein [Lachnospiraceae bacterium]|nr:flavodoxin family protein [Lachnospiraceae bacterium]